MSAATIAFSALGMTFVILKLLGPRRAAARRGSRDEGLGLDVTQHGEEAYAQGEGAILVLRDHSGTGRCRSAVPVLDAQRGSRRA